MFEGLAGDLEDLYASSVPCDATSKSWTFKRLFFWDPQNDDLLDSISLPATYASEGMVTKLAHHFPASCALATFPAVDALDLDIGQMMVRVRNRNGVCVWDVVSALARK